MNLVETTKDSDLQRIVKDGEKIYKKIKSKYESNHKGKFLAIEVESKEAYMAKTSADAVVLAKSHYPNKIFYVVKIGFDVAETFSSLLIIKRKQFH